MQGFQGFWTSVFLVVVAGCLVALVAAVVATARPERRVPEGALTAVSLLVWVALTSIPVGAGWVTAANPLPGAPLTLLVFMMGALGLGFSPLGRRLAFGLPLGVLVGFQGFRFPLELVLHGWAEEGIAPPQMTWTGQNLDIVAGLTCLALAPFVGRSRAAAWISQVVGIGLLANVLRIVVLSLPTPLRAFDDALLLPFALPQLWIASVCVTSAVLWHVLTVRRLLSQSS